MHASVKRNLQQLDVNVSQKRASLSQLYPETAKLGKAYFRGANPVDRNPERPPQQLNAEPRVLAAGLRYALAARRNSRR